MENRKEKRLEGLLKAVQDIKSDYYVGTREAYKSVKRIATEVYENPGRTAIMVNHVLKQKFINPTYEATPERVYGTFNVLSDGILDTIEFFDESDETNFFYTLDYDNAINSIGHLFDIMRNMEFKMQPSDLSRIMTPYFVRGNEKKVFNDEEFGEEVVNYLDNDFKNYSENISSQHTLDYSKWYSIFLFNVNKRDWNKELSKESLNRNLTSYRNLILARELNLPNIVDRLINDRYEHRLKYRRQVLSHWLEDRENYGEIVRDVDNLIKSREERYKRLSLLNAPLDIIETERKLIQSARYIRHVLGSEKRFVKKCLGEEDEK